MDRAPPHAHARFPAWAKARGPSLPVRRRRPRHSCLRAEIAASVRKQKQRRRPALQRPGGKPVFQVSLGEIRRWLDLKLLTSHSRQVIDSTLEQPWSPLLIPVLLLRPYAKGLKGPPLVGFVLFLACYRASLVAQTVKRLLTLREAWVRSLGREDPLAKEMAPHCSTLKNAMDFTS